MSGQQGGYSCSREEMGGVCSQVFGGCENGNQSIHAEPSEYLCNRPRNAGVLKVPLWAVDKNVILVHFVRNAWSGFLGGRSNSVLRRRCRGPCSETWQGERAEQREA